MSPTGKSRRLEASRAIALDRWKSAIEAASRTTGIIVILFAGLLVSFMALWAGLDAYPGAIAATRSAEFQILRADRDRQQIQRTALGRLTQRAEMVAGCTQFRKDLLDPTPSTRELDFVRYARCVWEPFRERASLDGIDPDLRAWLVRENEFERTRGPTLQAFVKKWTSQVEDGADTDLTDFRGFETHDWLRPMVNEAIEFAFSDYAQRRQTARETYTQTRVRAESTSFSLLGLDFSVGGYWAWPVWLAFFLMGMIQIWLSRRRLIRQCRVLHSSLDETSRAAQTSASIADGLPLWSRPLRCGEPWARALVRRISDDAAADPLSGLAAALFVICLVIALLFVAPMGFVSNRLLSPEGFDLWRSLHAAVMCLLVATIGWFATTWATIPSPSDDKRQTRGFRRRAFITAALWAVGVTGVGVAEVDEEVLSRRLLAPRRRKLRGRPRTLQRRIRRAARPTPTLETGFYEDENGMIHFVPESGRTKSLAGRSDEGAGLAKLKSDRRFEAEDLPKVHPTALVSLVAAGVRQRLRGLTHKPASDQDEDQEKMRLAAKAQSNKQNRGKFEDAFAFVKGAIETSGGRQRPYHLLGLLTNIAVNSGAPTLLKQARDLLDNYESLARRTIYEANRAQVTQSIEAAARDDATRAMTTATPRTRHSRHSRRKKRSQNRKLQYLLKAYGPLAPPNAAVGGLGLPESWRLGLRSDRGAPEAAPRPVATRPAEELEIFRQVISKAAVGEDFSQELARLAEPTGDLVTLSDPVYAVTTKTSNQTHVTRTRKKQPKPQRRERLMRRRIFLRTAWIF